MIPKKLIQKINELSKKSKTIGLTDEEKKLQSELRQEYLKLFRKQFEDQLTNIKILDENNVDITPEKIKIKKREKDKNEK